MQDGGVGAGARHEAAARACEANLILSCCRTSIWDPPVGGTFHFENLIGNPGGSPDRARKALNADTIREMHLAFRRGGRKAIEKVMRNQPAAGVDRTARRLAHNRESSLQMRRVIIKKADLNEERGLA